jgi:ABC-2 type transport system ATP-binding protein
MTPPVLTAESLHKKFDNRIILEDASLRLEAGRVHGLIGLNGAGKTTLIRILLGLLKPDGGSSVIGGLTPRRSPRGFYRQLGVVLENNGFFPTLSIQQNLRFYAQARGMSARDADRYFQEHWSDTAIADTGQKARDLSRGQKMQCALCRAFLGWPSVYLLDEPVVALDMTAYDHFCELVRKARDRGAAVLISSHQLDAIEELCDSASLLENAQLHDLSIAGAGAAGAKKCWRLRVSQTDGMTALIRRVAGESSDPTLQGDTWHFKVEDEPDRVVPELVRRLVEAGVAVLEIAPERPDLRASLRRHYRKGQQ